MVEFHPAYQTDMYHVWERRELYTGFWLGNLRERDHLGGPGIDRRIILK
jgi:hypothetical protein